MSFENFLTNYRQIFSSLIPLHYLLLIFSILGVYVNNLHPLETIVQHCRFFAVIRDGLDLSAYSVEDYDPIALSDELKVCEIH